MRVLLGTLFFETDRSFVFLALEACAFLLLVIELFVLATALVFLLICTGRVLVVLVSCLEAKALLVAGLFLLDTFLVVPFAAVALLFPCVFLAAIRLLFLEVLLLPWVFTMVFMLPLL